MKPSIFICIMLCAGLVSLPARGIDDYGELYQIKKGDTPQSVAKQQLGDAGLADALLNFNKLDAQSFGSYEQQYIAIPKVIMEQALSALSLSASNIAKAEAAQAAAYAAIELKEAQFLRKLAQSAYDTGGFNKAAQQASLANRRALEAFDLSNKRALKPSSARIEAGQQTVTAHVPGSQPRLLKQGEKVSGASRLSTGAARGQLLLGKHTKVLLHEETSVVLEVFHYDARTNVESHRLRLEKGGLEWERLSPDPARSSLAFAMADGPVTVNPGAGILTQQSTNTACISVFDGQVTTGSGATVAKGRGLVWENGKAGRVEALPECPVLSSGKKLLRFADQTPTLTWSRDAAPEALVDVAVANPGGSFVSPVQRHAVAGHSVTLDLLPAKQYLLRMMGRSPKGLLSPPSRVVPMTIALDLTVKVKVTPEALVAADKTVVSPNHLILGIPANEDSSVTAVEYQLDNQPYEAIEDGFILFEPGQHVVRIRGLAADGSQGPVVQKAFLLDKQAPDVQCIVQTGFDAADGLEQTMLSLEARDENGVASIEYQMNDGAFMPYTQVINTRLLEETTFTYRAADKLGNRSRPRSMVLRP